MRWFGSAIQAVCGLALVACGLVGCSDAAPNGPAPGVATVAFVPRPVVLPYIDLTNTTVNLDRLVVIGNMPPPPPPGQPPPNRPPPNFPPPSDVDLDVLSTAPSSASIQDLPQGLYSHVRFTVGRIKLDGRWRGTVFHVSFAPFGVIVDLRASMPQELGLDQDVNFQVGVDPNIWFPPYLFDGAMPDNRGEIICDDVSNVQVGMILTQALASSFSLP